MKADNFDDQSAIIVALNRIIGVTVFSNSSNFRLFFSIFYKLVAIATLAYIVYLNCVLVHANHYNYIATIVYIVLLLVAFLCILTMQMLGWWYYKEVILLRKNIAETDESLKKLNVVVNHRNVFVWTVSICIITFFNGLLTVSGNMYMVYDRYMNLELMYGDVIYASVLCIGGLVVLDFMAHVCWLRNNFKKTNDLLERFFIEECHIGMKEWNNKLVSSWLERYLKEWHIECFFRGNKISGYSGTHLMKRQLYPANKSSMLQQIRYVHLQLCVITKSLNRIFDKQIMLFSTLSTLNLVAVLYYCYVESTNPSSIIHKTKSLMSFYILDGFYVWMKIVLVSRLCEKTVKEAKNISQIIHVCSTHNSDIELKSELIQFSLQISLSEIDREDAHLFWLNDTFVSGSIGTVVTYLLVMIQWNETLNLHG